MTEFELIEYFFNQQHQDSHALKDNALKHHDNDARVMVTKGLGDDAAVVTFNSGHQWVTCVDTMVQGRHFSDNWEQVKTLAFAIGYKSVVVNVSDLAAMGATPHSILLALALPECLANKSWLADFSKGLFHACEQFGVRLIGGDTTRSEKLVISITANGVLSTETPPVYRSGAQVGDKVYVSGTIGDASYALNHPDTEVGHYLGHRLHMPTPRVTLGRSLATEKLATAMIDVSDGLVQDLNHICQQSNVSIRLDLEKLPSSDPLKKVELADRLLYQLTGGDDYELAFTLPASVDISSAKMSSFNTTITCIGEVMATENHLATKESHLHKNSQSLNSIHQDKNVLLVKLAYEGNEITQNHPYPFNCYPTLSGYQHFSHSSSNS